jgi:hypothetical protein
MIKGVEAVQPRFARDDAGGGSQKRSPLAGAENIVCPNSPRPEDAHRGVRDGLQISTPTIVRNPASLLASHPTKTGDGWSWDLYHEASGAIFGQVTVAGDPDSDFTVPLGGPIYSVDAENSELRDLSGRTIGTIDLRARGFSWNREALRLAVGAFQTKFRRLPPYLEFGLEEKNLATFQRKYAQIHDANSDMDLQAVAVEAAKELPFGQALVALGYGDLRFDYLAAFSSVRVGHRQLTDVPTIVVILARPTAKS